MLLPCSGYCAPATSVLLLWLSLSLCSAAYVQKYISDVPGYKLASGVSNVPVPLTVSPDQAWMGIDGQWNTFTLRLGSQKSVSQVLPSTASQQIWVVNPKACERPYLDPETNETTNTFDVDRSRDRGWAFNLSDSTTWKEQGFYYLWVGGNYGLYGRGLYGYDTVQPGIPGEEGPVVQNTTVGTLINNNFWLGHLGLHYKSTNFTTNMTVPPVPSYMTRLFEQRSIPSLSFGYTAGVQYRDPMFLASLTIGGTDASRYISNDVSFVFAPDNERELVVGLAGLTASSATRSNINLLTAEAGNVKVAIDSTVAELWLPLSICKAFEEAFGLTYDNVTDLYLVDDLLHATLKAQNPNVTFSLQQTYATNGTVDITLPYAAFDLQAKSPYRGLSQATRYFPLRRGDNSTQWTLGRTFLQEAYLQVDWERERFSVYQTDWTYGKAADIVPIISPDYLASPDATSSNGLGTGTGIGLALGCVSVAILAAVAAFFWRRRRRAVAAAKRAADAAEVESARKPSPSDTEDDAASSVTEKGPNIFPKAELPGHSTVYRHEMGATGKEKASIEIVEVDSTERPVYEMLGDIPTPQEAAGRQLSEKETMMVREKNINGVDPNANLEPISPVPRPAPVASLDQIATVRTSIPSSGVSPITPRAPTDGAHLEAGDTFYQLPPYRAQQEGRSVDNPFSPISPLDAPTTTDNSRRRFSYES